MTTTHKALSHLLPAHCTAYTHAFPPSAISVLIFYGPHVLGVYMSSLFALAVSTLCKILSQVMAWLSSLFLVLIQRSPATEVVTDHSPDFS